MSRRKKKFVSRRKEMGYSQATIGKAVGANEETVRGWEAGRRTPAPPYRPLLCEALNVSPRELGVLLEIVDETETEPHAVPPLMTLYDSLVAGAGKMESLEKAAVPGLFQTWDYATAAHLAGNHSAVEIAENVDSRMTRQQVLFRDDRPLHLTVLLWEVVLYDEVGGASVMADQLAHMAALSQRPNIELRLLPANGCASRAANGFDLLTKWGELGPYLAVTVSPNGKPTLDDDVAQLARIWHDLAAASLPPDETSRRITDINHTRYR